MSTQVEKDYENDWAKAKSRELVREIVATHPMVRYRPEKIKVLFLPGVDAAEIFQVYDRLGIPRTNLVGVERDREVYMELQKQNLGIQLVNSDLETYVANLPRIDFDVLSFDFTGAITLGQRKLISRSIRNNTKDNLIVHVANQVRREGKHSKDNYIKGATFQYLDMRDSKRLFTEVPGCSTKLFYDSLKESEKNVMENKWIKKKESIVIYGIF